MKQQVFVRRGTLFANEMPFSEVCMFMGIAGKIMGCEIVGDRPVVQLYDIPSKQPFSFPILLGEAGVFEQDGKYYVYREVCDA